jgi:hypothetical protein
VVGRALEGVISGLPRHGKNSIVRTMSKVVDALSILLVLGASLAFAVGVAALGERRDLAAIYWLAIGGLVLRAAVELLRPRSSAR